MNEIYVGCRVKYIGPDYEDDDGNVLKNGAEGIVVNFVEGLDYEYGIEFDEHGELYCSKDEIIVTKYGERFEVGDIIYDELKCRVGIVRRITDQRRYDCLVEFPLLRISPHAKCGERIYCEAINLRKVVM